MSHSLEDEWDGEGGVRLSTYRGRWKRCSTGHVREHERLRLYMLCNRGTNRGTRSMAAVAGTWIAKAKKSKISFDGQKFERKCVRMLPAVLKVCNLRQKAKWHSRTSFDQSKAAFSRFMCSRLISSCMYAPRVAHHLGTSTQTGRGMILFVSMVPNCGIPWQKNRRNFLFQLHLVCRLRRFLYSLQFSQNCAFVVASELDLVI